MDERNKNSQIVLVIQSNMRSLTETIQSIIFESAHEYSIYIVKESFNKYDDLGKRTSFIQRKMENIFGGKWSVWICLDEDISCTFYKKSHYIHLKIGGYFVIIYNNN